MSLHIHIYIIRSINSTNVMAIKISEVKRDTNVDSWYVKVKGKISPVYEIMKIYPMLN
jgi:hypothetical protein